MSNNRVVLKQLIITSSSEEDQSCQGERRLAYSSSISKKNLLSFCLIFIKAEVWREVFKISGKLILGDHILNSHDISD